MACRIIRRQMVKNCEIGNSIKIGDNFHKIDSIVKIPETAQVFITYAGEKTRTIKGVKCRLREMKEYHGDDFVYRQRQKGD